MHLQKKIRSCASIQHISLLRSSGIASSGATVAVGFVGKSTVEPCCGNRVFRVGRKARLFAHTRYVVGRRSGDSTLKHNVVFRSWTSLENDVQHPCECEARGFDKT